MKDLIGFYQGRDQAERVKDELIAAGFDRGDITIYERGDKDEASFWASIKDAFGFADEDDQQIYAEATRRGAVAVGLSFDDDDPGPQRAAEIMNRHGAIDLDQQAATWRQTGWTGHESLRRQHTQQYATGTAGTHAAGTTHTAQTGRTTQAAAGQQHAQRLEQGKEVIPVVEEQIRVGKREVVGGGLRIHSRITERPVREQVNLREERVTVERHPVDRPVSDADKAFKERAVEVTERKEQAVVAKDARVVEEVVVNKDVTQRTETVEDTVRRTDVDVQKVAGTSQHGRDVDFVPDRFANELASDARYRDRDWTTVEADARRTYESRYPGGSKWEQVKDSIRRGYDNVRRKV